MDFVAGRIVAAAYGRSVAVRVIDVSLRGGFGKDRQRLAGRVPIDRESA